MENKILKKTFDILDYSLSNIIFSNLTDIEPILKIINLEVDFQDLTSSQKENNDYIKDLFIKNITKISSSEFKYVEIKLIKKLRNLRKIYGKLFILIQNIDEVNLINNFIPNASLNIMIYSNIYSEDIEIAKKILQMYIENGVKSNKKRNLKIIRFSKYIDIPVDFIILSENKLYSSKKYSVILEGLYKKYPELNYNISLDYLYRNRSLLKSPLIDEKLYKMYLKIFEYKNELFFLEPRFYDNISKLIFNLNIDYNNVSLGKIEEIECVRKNIFTKRSLKVFLEKVFKLSGVVYEGSMGYPIFIDQNKFYKYIDISQEYFIEPITNDLVYSYIALSLIEKQRNYVIKFEDILFSPDTILKLNKNLNILKNNKRIKDSLFLLESDCFDIIKKIKF